MKHWIGLANLIKSSLCKHTAITFDDSATVVSHVESTTTLGRTICSGNTADEYHCDMKLDTETRETCHQKDRMKPYSDRWMHQADTLYILLP